MTDQPFDLLRGVEESAEGFTTGEALGGGPEDPAADFLGVAGGLEGFVDGATGKPINPMRDAQEALNYITDAASSDYGASSGD